MIKYTGTYTDYYQLTMSQVYFLRGQAKTKAIFDYFFRKLPFRSGYAVFAGLEEFLEALGSFEFNKEELDFLKEKGFHPEFLRYLKTFRFTGNIYTHKEGDLVFPVSPVMQVEASIIEAQLVESLLLNILNFQTLIATKASRMRTVAGDHYLIDFGLRRAQGTGALQASRAAHIGGYNATSNVMAGRIYNIPVSGTMAHSYVESYDEELTAFIHFAEENPENCVLLVDTYDTLNSGLPNAISVAKTMESRGRRVNGIRIDSGDLAYLSKECRRRLDLEGLGYVQIAVSNRLDEYIVKSLLDQKAPIDIFGVGTNMITGSPDGALDGVYKLSYSGDKPRIKFSGSVGKITIPHKKQVFRILDKKGNFQGADMIALYDEHEMDVMHHPMYPGKSISFKGFAKEPLLHSVMINGVRLNGPLPLTEIADNCRERMKKLPEEYKRFDNPHIYKVGLSTSLKDERDRLIEEWRQTYESAGDH